MADMGVEDASLAARAEGSAQRLRLSFRTEAARMIRECHERDGAVARELQG